MIKDERKKKRRGKEEERELRGHRARVLEGGKTERKGCDEVS